MRRLAIIVLLAFLGAACLAPNFAQASSNSQTRADRKAQKKQQKAMKKYLKAQKKAQQKMIKQDRKNTHLPSHY